MAPCASSRVSGRDSFGPRARVRTMGAKGCASAMALPRTPSFFTGLSIAPL